MSEENQGTARMVHCAKYDQTLPGLEHAPMPGPVGERLYDQVSQAAWDAWVKHSTMVINEFRLNPSQPEARQRLQDAMLKFLFEDQEELPPDFVDPQASTDATPSSPE